MQTRLTRNGYSIKKNSISEKILNEIKTELTISPIIFKAYKNLIPDNPLKIFTENKNKIYVPRYYGIQKFGLPIDDLLTKNSCNQINVQVNAEIREYQQKGYNALINAFTNGFGGVFSIWCGYGKTIVAIILALKVLKCKTLVIVNQEFLVNQWIDRIKQVAPTAKIGRIQGSLCDTEDKDIIIGMIQSLSKKDYIIPFDHDLTIYDEIHTVPTKVFSKSLKKVGSKYMLGLSATPDRKDGLSKVFYYYIGNLIYSEKRTGTNNVFVKQLQLKSKSKYFEKLTLKIGKPPLPNNTGMIKNITNFPEFNNLLLQIITLLMKHDRQILLVSKMRKHLELLKTNIENAHIIKWDDTICTAGLYYGNKGSNKKTHNKMLKKSEKCDVVLGTIDICKQGLDIIGLNTLINTASGCEPEQSTGRILRRLHDKDPPLVIDCVYNMANFTRQGADRKRYYKKENFEIHSLDIDLDNLNNDIDLIQLETFLNNFSIKEKTTKSTNKTMKTIENDNDCII